jgi:hypothetical protein
LENYWVWEQEAWQFWEAIESREIWVFRARLAFWNLDGICMEFRANTFGIIEMI